MSDVGGNIQTTSDSTFFVSTITRPDDDPSLTDVSDHPQGRESTDQVPTEVHVDDSSSFHLMSDIRVELPCSKNSITGFSVL